MAVQDVGVPLLSTMFDGGGTPEGNVICVSMVLPDGEVWAARTVIPEFYPVTHYDYVVDALEAHANKVRAKFMRLAYGAKH